MEHIKRLNEMETNATRNFNESASVDRSMDNTYQLSLLINRLYTASKPYTQHGYSDED